MFKWGLRTNTKHIRANRVTVRYEEELFVDKKVENGEGILNSHFFFVHIVQVVICEASGIKNPLSPIN